MLDAGLSTISYLKSRLLPEAGVDETQWDVALGRLGNAVAGMLQRHCNRLFDASAEQVDEFNAAGSAFVLRRYPIDEITGLALRNFDGTSDDISTTHYQMDQAAGLLDFATAPGVGTERLVVTYSGGYWLDDGEEMPAGGTPLPDELLEAWVIQCQAMAAARAIFGSVALSDPKAPKISGEMLPEVAEILRSYRRFSGE